MTLNQSILVCLSKLLAFLYKNFILLLYLLIILLIILNPDKFSSRVTPRYVTSGPDPISIPLHVMFSYLHLASRLFEPKRIDLVLPRCNDKRFSANHSLTDSNSCFKISSISDTSLLDARSAESSAYKSSLHLTAASTSLTYIKNKKDQVLNLAAHHM